MQKYQMYIGGKYTDSASGKWFDSYNPYTGEVWAQTARMGDPMSLDTHVGPVTTRPQYEKVLGYINTGAATGNPFVLR